MHPVGFDSGGFTGNLGLFTVNAPVGVIDGTRTHLLEGHILVPRLLRPRPPKSACKELNLDRSLIGRLHDRRATGGNRLSSNVSDRRPDSNRRPLDHESITLRHRPVCRQVATRALALSLAELRLSCRELVARSVWVAGLAPAASCSRSTRSTFELHPDARAHARCHALRDGKKPCLKAGHHPAALLPHGGPHESGRSTPPRS